MSFSSLPPWLLPALIVHVALFAVLLLPTWRAFAKAGIGGAWSLVLILPGLGLIVVAVLLGAPVLRRAGWTPAWAILAIIPLVNVVFLWLFAYARWTRTRTEPVDEPQTARRAEPRIAVASARVAAPEPTLSRSTDDGYEGVDPHNRGLADEIDTPPAVGEIDLGEVDVGEVDVGKVDLGERTMIAGAAAPKAPPAEAGAETATPQAARPGPVEPVFTKPKAAKPGATKPEAREPEEAKSEEAKSEPKSEAPKPERAQPEAPKSEAPKSEAPQLEATKSDVPKSDAPADAETPPAVPEEPAAKPEPELQKELFSDELTLAAGVLSDLEAAEAAPEPPPVARTPGDEDRTVPVRHAAADGPRVWTLRGVNARSANIEVTIREEDLSQSDAGILVGRSSRVDFIIGDESVSRNHARFVYHDGALCVEDLDSMNGTWVDGAQLDSNQPTPVADQSEVEFGKIKLLVTETAA